MFQYFIFSQRCFAVVATKKERNLVFPICQLLYSLNKMFLALNILNPLRINVNPLYALPQGSSYWGLRAAGKELFYFLSLLKWSKLHHKRSCTLLEWILELHKNIIYTNHQLCKDEKESEQKREELTGETTELTNRVIRNPEPQVFEMNSQLSYNQFTKRGEETKSNEILVEKKGRSFKRLR